MTAKIKLNAASGGGSFSLQAPSSSANNRVMTLPDSADGTVLTTTNPKAGNIIQVVQTYRTSTFSESLTEGNYSAAVMTAAITPASSNSKILVLCTVHVSTGGGTNGAQARLARDGTAIGIGDAADNRTRATGAGLGSSTINRQQSNIQMTFLDSPSSTSALSYTAHIKPGFSGTQTVHLNREGDGDSGTGANVGRSASSLTLLEVAV